MGSNALKENTTGANNVAVGALTLDAANNVAIGYDSLTDTLQGTKITLLVVGL